MCGLAKCSVGEPSGRTSFVREVLRRATAKHKHSRLPAGSHLLRRLSVA